jgi:hypothetical protein
VLSAQHGSGKRSNVRTACFVAPGAAAAATAHVASDCAFVAVLKCLGGGGGADASASASAPFVYDAAVASLLTRLVEARVSPHFTMLYHASAPLHSQPGTPCMLLERNERTLSRFLSDSGGELPVATQFAIAFQVAHAVLAAFVAFGVSHNDLHRQNVMGVQVDAGLVYTYEVFGTVFRVPLHGWLWKLIDFDHADIGMSHRHARHNWYAAKHVAGQPPMDPIHTFGPATDVSSGMPDLAKRLSGDLVADFLRDRGTSSPAVQIEALLRVLHECCVRAEGAVLVLGAAAAEAAMFSLNNDAAAVPREADGFGLAIHSARTYTLRDRVAPVEKVARTLVGMSDATAYRVPAPTSAVIVAEEDGAGAAGAGAGAGAGTAAAAAAPSSTSRKRGPAADGPGRDGTDSVKAARLDGDAKPVEVIVISSSSSSSLSSTSS